MAGVPRDHGLDNLRMVAGSLGLAGAVLLIGAVVAYATGDAVGRVRTHMDAFLVLLALGLASLVATVPVLERLKARSNEPEPGRSHFE